MINALKDFIYESNNGKDRMSYLYDIIIAGGKYASK